MSILGPCRGGPGAARCNFYEIFISGAVKQPRIYTRYSRYSNRLKAFSGELETGYREIRDGPRQQGAFVMRVKALLCMTGDAPERTSNARLRSRLCLCCHWRGGLCRHGALSERLRQVVREDP